MYDPFRHELNGGYLGGRGCAGRRGVKGGWEMGQQ